MSCLPAEDPPLLPRKHDEMVSSYPWPSGKCVVVVAMHMTLYVNSCTFFLAPGTEAGVVSIVPTFTTKQSLNTHNTTALSH